MTQTFELNSMKVSDFFSKFYTGTLIEERIKLMLGDEKIDSIFFADGDFSYKLKGGPHQDLPSWKFSEKETIQILQTFSDRAKEILHLSEDILEGLIQFEDYVLSFDNFEVYPYGDPEDEERSSYMFHILKPIGVAEDDDLELPF